MRDLQNKKRDLPHSLPFEVEGVRIVVISFRNIVKNQRTDEKIVTIVKFIVQFI